MFDSLLIANRGEIACRIIKTAHRLGLRAIAVYSDADVDALHVKMADQAVRIGPPPAAESYLLSDRIIEAARNTGAGAIHPGYGFLSEQPDLTRACAEHDIVWVGPHLKAITSMGSKIEAKQIAQAAGVPCIPGYAGSDQYDTVLIAKALQIGLPVMIKASAGGGGKGMRAVWDVNDLAEALTSARTEAKRAFGDDQLLVEKLVQNPRHIEVQLLGDKRGNLIHLFDRDCSVQRNHQKLLEEAPAPNLSDATRASLFEAALRLGRDISYDSTGTVEFIMNAATEEFFFLEMNTRLQVEHTVTEEVTGLDLVEQQLLVASGKPLSLKQDQIVCTGHAIEARVTAENAAAAFRPETGAVLHWRADPHLRCDTGIQTGSDVGPNYDSMIAKLVSHAPDREMACRKLLKGLETLEVAGVQTTRLFLRDAVSRPTFLKGRATTDFLTQEWPDGYAMDHTDSLALAALATHTRSRASATPWQALKGFRILQAAGHPARTTYLDVSAPDARVTIADTPEGYVVSTDEGSDITSAHWTGKNQMIITRKGVQETLGAVIDGTHVYVWGHNIDVMRDISAVGSFGAASGQDQASSVDRITAPMPGMIVELRVNAGTSVMQGDTLLVMESMKLLMDLKAPVSGTIQKVATDVGQTVENGALLIQLDPHEKED